MPSLTESIASTRPEALVGATTWCTHPAGLDVARVRGTKNPDRATIIRLRPDLVLANQEENRRVDVEYLRSAGIPVWVTVTETLDQGLAALQRVFSEALGWPRPSWLTEAVQVWAEPASVRPISAVVPIWRDPWMVVGRDTFAGDLAARLGLVNLFADSEDRYPQVDLDAITGKGPELVVLPDEPYAFGADDGPEVFPDATCLLVEGRLLTWYGPSLVTARSTLTGRIEAALSRGRARRSPAGSTRRPSSAPAHRASPRRRP